MSVEAAPKRSRKNRTNAEILEALKAERRERSGNSDKPARKSRGTGKRHRRTRAEIEADNAARQKRLEQLAEERAAHIPAPKPVVFHKKVKVLVDGLYKFGNYYNSGDVIDIKEDTREFVLSFNAAGEFIFDLTPEQQLAKWGVVKYEVEDLSK